MSENRPRSLVKALTWRIEAIAMLMLLSWLITRNWGDTMLIVAIFQSVQTILFYLHERIWLRVKWGVVDNPRTADLPPPNIQ
jgi:uncharacterized membrane protein